MSTIAIEKYYNEVERLIDYGGTKKETAIRNAFYNLLNDYASPKGLVLVPELTIKSVFGNNITPDGTLKDSFQQKWGYWESKDEADDIDLEIEKKFAKGYPDDNILFEDSKTAVLFQMGREISRVSVNNPDALDRIIKAFVNYEIPKVTEFRNAIELFKINIPSITEALRNVIKESADNPEFQTKNADFLETCKQAINTNITQEDVNEMMIQHILTADIFNTIFDDPYFHRDNNIALQLENVIDTFFTKSVRNNLFADINHYYQAINATAAGIADHHEKQKFLKVVYETFYKSYNPKAADRLGVVYTPNEIVRFMIESTDYLLYKHFGRFIYDKNVEILDPATGTGTFICDLIDYIRKDKLEYKYKNEIHANEVAILPYYIANLNIEFTYKQRMNRYEEFKNLCFVDTLDNMGFDFKNKQNDMFGLTAENTERIKRQNERKISVIIGNPPYNANQMNENDNNKNREYPAIDKRIKDTYIKNSTAQKTKMYDMYSRFYRWAMDRLGDEGIIAFITNRSFINSRTFDGFRKIASSEFDHIYIIDLGGDVRANPQLSGPKHNVFAIQTGVAIMFLIKTEENRIVVKDEEEFLYLKKSLKLKNVVSEPEVIYGDKKYISSKGCRIFYIRRPEMETAKEKIDFLSFTKIKDLIKNGTFEHIIPDKNNNWINLSENEWEELIPIKNIFNLILPGVNTARDEWVFDINKDILYNKVNYFCNIYNNSIDNKVNIYSENIKWSEGLKNNFKKNKIINLNESLLKEFNYRPFYKVNYYADRLLSDRLTQNHFNIFGKDLNKINLSIVINSSGGTQKPFSSLCTKYLAPFQFYVDPTECLPLYRYDTEGNRIENITDWGQEQFRERYEENAPHPNPPREQGGNYNLNNNHPASIESQGENEERNIPHPNPPRKQGGNEDNDDVDKNTLPACGEGKGGVYFSYTTGKDYQSGVYNNHPDCIQEHGEYEDNNIENNTFTSCNGELGGNEDNDGVDKNTLPACGEGKGGVCFNWQVPPQLWYKLKPIARELRRNQTPAEQLLWQYIRNEQISNTKFRRQHCIERFIVDFYNYEYKIIIEIDGDIHQYQVEEDKIRQEFLEALGYEVIRFKNDEIIQNLDNVLNIIQNTIENRKSYFMNNEINIRKITKEDIFHYVYAVLHNPEYRKKYELNLKREFPRIPFYDDFWKWSDWGALLMDLHINFETVEPYPLKITHYELDKEVYKPKLKANKDKGEIILDNITTLSGIPNEVWDYKLGNRSALEWILDQYKEKKPKDPTIAEKFNTYRFIDYKDKVIDLIMRVTTVSVETMRIIEEMDILNNKIE